MSNACLDTLYANEFSDEFYDWFSAYISIRENITVDSGMYFVGLSAVEQFFYLMTYYEHLQDRRS